MSMLPSSSTHPSTIRRAFALGSAAVPIALVGSMLCVAPAHATTTSVSSKAALNSAMSGAGNGDVITLGQDLLGDGGVNDVLTTPANNSVTLDLNGHELDIDRLEVGDSATLTLTDSSGVGLLAVGDASATSGEVSGVEVSSFAILQVNAIRLRSAGSANRPGIGTISGDDDTTRLFIGPGATVTAQGGSHGAGIGGGAGARPLRTISIGDATVTATGGAGGAGIGGGYANPSGSNLIKVENTPNGTVTAIGGAGAAGIGGGQASGAGTGVGSPVTLADADVTVADGGSTAGSGPAPSAIGGGQGAAASGSGSLSHTFSGTTGRRDALRIAAGATLTVPSGRTITNGGTLVVRGTLNGSGSIDNTGGTIRQEGAGVIDDGALSVTGRNYAVTFDAAGGTTSAPATKHVYAMSFANAGLDLGAYTGSNAGSPLNGWTAGGTTVTSTTDLATIASGNTVALTAAYAAAVGGGGGGGGGGSTGGVGGGTTGGGGASGSSPSGIGIGSGSGTSTSTGTGTGTSGGTTTSTGSTPTTATPATTIAAPTLRAVKPTTIKLGRPLSVSVAASSAAPVTYTAVGLPTGIAIDASSGLLYGAARTSGRFEVRVTATNAGGSGSTTVILTVPEATRVITGSLGAVTPTAGSTVAVTIRGLKVGERWTVAVDGKPVRTGVTRFGGTVRSAVEVPKKGKDTKHVIRVSSDRALTDLSQTAVHELTITAVVAKKALTLTKKGQTFTVRGLAAKERVSITRGHTVVATGRADANGVFVVKKKVLRHGVHTVTGAAKGRTDRLKL